MTDREMIIDKMTRRIAIAIANEHPGQMKYTLSPTELAMKILSISTHNGYSLKEMVEFFSKIDRETQRAAVVKIKAELPENPFDDHVHLDAGQYDGLYRRRYFEAQEAMLKAGFVKEERGNE